MATTAVCNSAKVGFFGGWFCFYATQPSVSCSGSNTAFTLTGLASTAGIVVGMAATGSNVAASAVVASVDSATQVTLSKAHTGAVTSVTFTGDVFKMLLIKVTPSLTYGAGQTNVGTPGSGTPTTANVGTDEVSGTGYSSGGVALTNVSPSLPGNPSSTATVSFSPNPSWTSASFSTTACIVYDTNARIGAAATPLNNYSVSVHDFGGTQTVSNGTLTVLMPTNDGTNAILRIA